MKSARLLLAAVLVFMLGVTAEASAQAGVARDTSITHVLYLVDGSTLVGKLISRDSATVTFETNGGILTVPASRVKELRPVTPAEVRGKEYWFPDANETRLFFAPTGRMLKKGEGYYSNTYLLLQNFVGGMSDKFTFGGGFSIVPSDYFLANNIYYLTPKVGVYNTPKTNVAVGLLAGLFPGSGFESSETFGIGYAVATRGGPDASVTAGAGFPFASGSLADRPVFMLGGAVRTSRRISLVTENYFYSEDFGDYDAFISYGLRFMGEKISTDFAFWNGAGSGVFPGIPYIAFAVKF